MKTSWEASLIRTFPCHSTAASRVGEDGSSYALTLPRISGIEKRRPNYQFKNVHTGFLWPILQVMNPPESLTTWHVSESFILLTWGHMLKQQERFSRASGTSSSCHVVWSADPFPASRLNLQRVSAIVPMGCAKSQFGEDLFLMLKPFSSLIVLQGLAMVL